MMRIRVLRIRRWIIADTVRALGDTGAIHRVIGTVGTVGPVRHPGTHTIIVGVDVLVHHPGTHTIVVNMVTRDHHRSSPTAVIDAQLLIIRLLLVAFPLFQWRLFRAVKLIQEVSYRLHLLARRSCTRGKAWSELKNLNYR